MGTMILMGGNEFRTECVAMDRAMLARLPEQPPRVVIVPTAAAHQQPAMAAQNGIRHFDLLGAKASAAMIISRADANSREIARQFERAGLVYLTGGNPWYLLQTLRETRCWEAIRAVWRRGGVVVGSSAGAMVLGDRMWWNNMWAVGLGMAPRAAVLPHHRITGELTPQAGLGRLGMLVVLGIAEATACLSEYGNVWNVRRPGQGGGVHGQGQPGLRRRRQHHHAGDRGVRGTGVPTAKTRKTRSEHEGEGTERTPTCASTLPSGTRTRGRSRAASRVPEPGRHRPGLIGGAADDGLAPGG